MAGEGPRVAAAAMLTSVLTGGTALDDAMVPDLPPPDRARALRLAAGVLRNLDRCDRALAAHMRKAPPAEVLNLLRVAVLELAQGGAAHGVVGAAVAAVRALPGGDSLAGLANAVLRKVADPAPDFTGLPVQRLPGWLRGRLDNAWGRAAVSGIEAAHCAEPPLDITPKPGAAVDLPGAVTLPTGSLRLAQAGQVSALPGYDRGDWWVQDAGAALAARLLDAQPGERVVDLCAAPGGKTLQLAAAGARVTAVDVSDARLGRLRANLSRTGLPAEVVVADALDWMPGEPADAVLLDAPCTATGTIRRHPDLPHIRNGASVAPLVALQARLLDRALAMVRPGGRVVYCTCSLLPEEGERQAEAALARHPGLTVVPAAGEFATPLGFLRTRPDMWADRGGIDGFFVACLRKAAG
jgi:16S rRNA (cytosine967-C5)-methyltransferase